jgi:hypothetical protein
MVMGTHLNVCYTYSTLAGFLKFNNAFRVHYYLLKIKAIRIDVGFKTAHKESDNLLYSAVSVTFPQCCDNNSK